MVSVTAHCGRTRPGVGRMGPPSVHDLDEGGRLVAGRGGVSRRLGARREREGAMRFRNPQVSMGGCAGVPEYSVTDADETLVRKLLAKLE